MSDLIKTAVITGGHAFDVIGFTQLFRALGGSSSSENCQRVSCPQEIRVDAYIQHIDDFASSPQEVRDSYEAIVFYLFMQETPVDEGRPWYAGKPRKVLEYLGETAQGIVILHHALLAYREWPLWSEIVGIEDRGFGYHHGQQIHTEIANSDHSITQGLRAWDMVDETYTVNDAGPGNTVLLTTEHPKSMRTLAWTRTHKNARVFCYESGHDAQAFRNANFQQVLTRGIEWVARRI